jgi:hypothetical protein
MNLLPPYSGQMSGQKGAGGKELKMKFTHDNTNNRVKNRLL